jgi:hypothetical protein
LSTILIKKPVPPEPTLEEFVSPLQQTIKDELGVKAAIGYGKHCVNCGQQQAVDARIKDAVESSTDPEPWLQALHGELIQTRADLKEYRTDNQILRTELDAVRGDVNPIKRMLYLFGAGLAGLGAKALWDLYLQQYIVNLIPLLLPLIP